jgi:cobalamin biosynthesis protein CobD/CbiB
VVSVTDPFGRILRFLDRSLHKKAYKVSVVQGVERWIVCTPFSVNVFVTLAKQQHFEYTSEALFKSRCVLLVTTVQNTGHVL